MIDLMKAFALDELAAAPALREVDPPTLGPGEVLVRVRASSVNPVDGAIAAGMLSGMVEHEFPVILGRDYAGVVEELGAGVTGFVAGDEVYGFVPHANPAVHDGSWTELIAVPQADSIAHRPASVDLAAAGVTPLAAITAMTAIDALELSEGDSVLIVGATGGVGTFATQLAARAGAVVIAPALSEDVEYLRGLGVDEVVDRDGDVAAAALALQPGGVGAILDLVSYAPGAFDAALRPGGRVASPNGAAGDGPGRTNVMSVGSPENLRRVAKLLDDGTLAVHIQETYDLARAGEAMQTLAATHTRGKLALHVS
jgi:NADPH:quinone reductase